MSSLLSAFYILTLCTILRAELPDYIQVCKRGNEDVSACIIKSIEILRTKLVDGIPELAVPALEPLKLDDIRVSTGLNINLTEVVINGAGKFEIKELNAELTKNRFAVLIQIPELDLNGQHNIDMKFVSIPLKGNGLFTAKITDFQLAFKLIGKVITSDDGVNYLKFDPFEIEVGYGGKKELSIEGLFEENETLKQTGKNIIQDNVDVFLDELKPEIQRSLSTTLTRIANKITTNFSYEELFPQ